MVILADLQQSSLRSLRKTILAFRAAAHMNQEDEDEIETKYKIDSAQGEFRLSLLRVKSLGADVAWAAR